MTLAGGNPPGSRGPHEVPLRSLLAGDVPLAPLLAAARDDPQVLALGLRATVSRPLQSTAELREDFAICTACKYHCSTI